MNQNFSNNKILHESSKLERFQLGLKILEVQTLGGEILDLSKIQISNNYQICNILDLEQKFTRLS